MCGQSYAEPQFSVDVDPIWHIAPLLTPDRWPRRGFAKEQNATNHTTVVSTIGATYSTAGWSKSPFSSMLKKAK